MDAPALRNEVGTLLQRYETEPEHVLHVARLAVELFDGLLPWHQLTGTDRLLLDTAACVHDIGWAVTQPDGKEHHKASARLIREFPWTTLTPAEVEIVALVARYHRKAIPKADHEAYSALSPADQRRVRVLAACLRIADGLDRRHIQRVDQIEVFLLDSALEIIVLTTHEAGAELAMAEKKADLLRQDFRGEVRFCFR